MVEKTNNKQLMTWPKFGAERKFNPKSMKLPLPFGRLNSVVALDGLRFRQIEEVLPDLESRLSKLGKYSELGLEVDAIKKVAVMKNVGGMDYLADWELRARLAEAELVGFYLDASKFAEKVSKQRSSDARKGKRLYPDQFNLVRDRCDRWVAEGMPEKREAILVELGKVESLRRVASSTIEGWWDQRKVQLVGKRRKKLSLPEI